MATNSPAINSAVMPLSPQYLRPGQPGIALWWRQFCSVFGQAIKSSLLSKKVVVALVLIMMPVTFLTIVGFIREDGQPLTNNITYARTIFGFVYSTFILGAVLYLGNALMFTSLVRGDILNRSVHYSLLAPVRREILVAGKFCGGLLSALLLFGTATIVCYLLIYIPYGTTRLSMDLSGGIAIEQMATYLLMTTMGCIGYGSVFMATGLLFRNPLIPVLVVAGWEAINFLLPAGLKVISVVYYLKSLMPVLIDEGPLPLAVVASPLSPAMAIFGILTLSAICITITVYYMRNLEIRYTDD